MCTRGYWSQKKGGLNTHRKERERERERAVCIDKEALSVRIVDPAGTLEIEGVAFKGFFFFNGTLNFLKNYSFFSFFFFFFYCVCAV